MRMFLTDLVLYPYYFLLIFFVACDNEKKDFIEKNQQEVELSLEDSTILEEEFMPRIDSVLYIEKKYGSHVQEEISDSLAEIIMKKQFKKEGIFTDDDYVPISDEVEGRLRGSYADIHQINSENSKNIIALIRFWLGEPYLNGHCFQPSNAFLYFHDGNYIIDDIGFIPESYSVDTVYVVDRQVAIELREYDCGNKRFLNRIRLIIK